MPTNQYNAHWAYNNTSNALTPAAWAALAEATKAAGFVPGIALSEHMNTLMRQLTTAMAAFSQWVVDKAGVDLPDDGNIGSYYFVLAGAMINAHQDTLNLAAPVGTVQAFAGAAAPGGWLMCNGAWVSRATYAALFNVIGLTYGNAGGNPSLFTLPDLRGEFLRGLDAGRGVDAGRALGSSQGQSTQLVQHSHFNGVAEDNPSGIFVYGSTTTDMPGASTGSITNVGGGNQKQGVTQAVGNTSETRPRNVAMNFIIKV